MVSNKKWLDPFWKQPDYISETDKNWNELLKKSKVNTK